MDSPLYSTEPQEDDNSLLLNNEPCFAIFAFTKMSKDIQEALTEQIQYVCDLAGSFRNEGLLT